MESPAAKSKYHKDRVVQALRASNWQRENGRIQLRELIQNFISFFSGGFSDVRLELLTQSHAQIEGAIRSLFRADRGVHPLWCILFAWFAESCEAIRHASQPVRRERSAPLTSEELTGLMAQFGTVTGVANALALNVAAVSVLCKRYGIQASWRPKHIDQSITEEVVAAFRQGSSPAEIQKRYRISRTAVYRIAAAVPDIVTPARRRVLSRTDAAKSHWLTARVQYPDLPDTTLRRMLPAVWAQLRRNAPDWLCETRRVATKLSPKKGRPEPSQPLLGQLEQAISAAEARCDKDNSLPGHKSLYRLRRLTGLSDYAFQATNHCLGNPRITESRIHFVRRRCIWAQSRLNPTSRSLWRVARTARLRPDSIRQAVSHFDANKRSSR
ncbi:TnsD family Tn7-like transposition protein [Paraburkholderia youngii]|uniref:TnsD family Tn7-like transposition protein n=1 Tax=Paraburkholderia youngii TaxID=2782701 RepID=UPI003D1A206C